MQPNIFRFCLGYGLLADPNISPTRMGTIGNPFVVLANNIPGINLYRLAIITEWVERQNLISLDPNT